MSDLVSQNLNMIFKTPKGETVHALKDVSFTLKKGELLTVLGPSGCGKTTLLNITAGFLKPTSGKIILNNNEIDGPGVERGMVFQQGALFEWLTVATVNHSNKAPCWNTIPLSTPGPSISLLFNIIFPEVGFKNPAVILSKVVFPQPEGPRTVSNSPFFKVKLTSLSA